MADRLIKVNPNPEKENYRLSPLAGLTPGQIDNYIDSNVVDLASAKDFLKKMARVMLLLAKHTALDEETPLTTTAWRRLDFRE